MSRSYVITGLGILVGLFCGVAGTLLGSVVPNIYSVNQPIAIVFVCIAILLLFLALVAAIIAIIIGVQGWVKENNNERKREDREQRRDEIQNKLYEQNQQQQQTILEKEGAKQQEHDKIIKALYELYECDPLGVWDKRLANEVDIEPERLLTLCYAYPEVKVLPTLNNGEMENRFIPTEFADDY